MQTGANSQPRRGTARQQIAGAYWRISDFWGNLTGLVVWLLGLAMLTYFTWGPSWWIVAQLAVFLAGICFVVPAAALPHDRNVRR